MAIKKRPVVSSSVQPVSISASSTTAHKAHRRGFVASMMIIIGLGLLALWVIVLLMQVGTNESFILGTNTSAFNAFTPNLNLLLQLPNLFTGSLSQPEALATIYGWGVELMVLGLTVGYEVVHLAFHQASPLMASIFKFLSVVAIALNYWSDFNYGSISSGFMGHFLFAAFCSSVIAVCGIAGVTLIKHGIETA